MSAVETALIAVGLAALVGGLAWTLAARRAAEARAEDVARIAQLEATMAAAAGQEQVLEDRMTALSSRLAEQQRKDFLDIAEERFKRLQSEAEKEAKAQITEMEGLVKPIEESLANLGEATQALEEKRIGAIAGVERQMQEVGALASRLGTEASNLSTALRRSSAVRGDWGEVALRNILELAGMNAHADFEEQASTDTGRPDVIVHLPGEGVIPIDAKATAKHYLEALEVEEGPHREALMDQHAKALRGRVTELTRKEYWSSFGDRAQFVVMFVPSEALISAPLTVTPACTSGRWTGASSSLHRLRSSPCCARWRSRGSRCNLPDKPRKSSAPRGSSTAAWRHGQPTLPRSEKTWARRRMHTTKPSAAGKAVCSHRRAGWKTCDL